MPDGGFPVRVDSVLLELASQRATGCLTLTEPEGDQSTVWFRDGQVYAVSVPGRRPLLGVRLMSSGALTPEALAEALEVQRTELQGWRLGELLVHLQFVDRAVVESFVTEQVRDQVADLLHWTVVESKFRNGKRTRQDVAPPIEVTDLLALAAERDSRWAEIVPFIGGADGVPVLSSADAASDVVLGPYDWALLCKVDGNRTIADLADDCGFTVFEAGMVVVGLLDAGLVEIENLASGVEAIEAWPDDVADEDPTEDELSASVAQVAAALADMNLGPSVASPFAARPVVHDVYAAPKPATGAARTPADDTPRRSPFAAAPVVEETLAEVVSLADEREARDGADAERVEAERAAAEAREVEQQRLEAEEAERIAVEAAELTRVSAELAAAEEERLEVERLDAERLEQERIAAEEAVRLEAERVEAERVEAEQAQHDAQRIEQERIEAAWAAAEQAAAEHAAAMRREHEEREAARLEAERLAAEQAEIERAEAERRAAERAEAERLEAERREAERLEQERLAAEEAARLEAERLEAERLAAEEAARLEAERLEAERLEQERIEQERLAAEEAARVEAERVEAERVEQERLAAEEAARLEAERLEQERLAAEEAARLEAERLEQERLAAEEAARLEAERLEQERLEAERLEAERREAERLEQERLAAEEAARLDAERLAAERLEAERLATEDAARAEAERREVERSTAVRIAAKLAEFDRIAGDDDDAEPVGMDLHAVNAEFTALSLDPPTTEPVELDTPTFDLDEEPTAPAAAYRPDFSQADQHYYEPELEPALAGGVARPEGTDMAALLRELSSLGGAFDSEQANDGKPAAHVVTRPVTASSGKDGKKKKGFFGR